MEEAKQQNFFKRIFQKRSTENEGKSKWKMIAVVVLSLVVILIFASSFKAEKKDDSTSLDYLSTSFRSLEYSAQLENKLKKVLSNVKDIGKVEVFVMVESSPQLKYLEETSSEISQNGDNKTSSNQTTIYEMRDGSIESPVVAIEIVPKITGVLIIASGAKDIKLKTTLINMVSSVLSVNVSNVEVLEGKN